MQPANEKKEKLDNVNKFLLASFLVIMIIILGVYVGYQYINVYSKGEISQSDMTPPPLDKINSDEQSQALSKLGATSKTNIKEEDKASILTSLSYKSSIKTEEKISLLDSLK